MHKEFEYGGATYKAGKLPAMKQFHIVRRLAALLPDLDPAALRSGSLEDGGKLIAPLLQNLAAMSDADTEYVINACLAVVERQQAAGGWARLLAGGRLMFEDLDMAAMLHITWEVLQHNLSGFLAGLPSDFVQAART